MFHQTGLVDRARIKGCEAYWANPLGVGSSQMSSYVENRLPGPLTSAINIRWSRVSLIFYLTPPPW